MVMSFPSLLPCSPCCYGVHAAGTSVMLSHREGCSPSQDWQAWPVCRRNSLGQSDCSEACELVLSSLHLVKDAHNVTSTILSTGYGRRVHMLAKLWVPMRAAWQCALPTCGAKSLCAADIARHTAHNARSLHPGNTHALMYREASGTSSTRKRDLTSACLCTQLKKRSNDGMDAGLLRPNVN